MPGYQTRLGHAHLKVRDLKRSVEFYTRVFNLVVVEQVGVHYAFLSGGAAHHEIALQQVGANAPGPPGSAVGLYHVAFEVPDRRAFALAYRALAEAGVGAATVDHRISWAIYFTDPDGNGLEIYWDTREQPSGRRRWEGEALPLPPERILAALEGA
jgi:catechol 2,3-dioxygenase